MVTQVAQTTADTMLVDRRHFRGLTIGDGQLAVSINLGQALGNLEAIQIRFLGIGGKIAIGICQGHTDGCAFGQAVDGHGLAAFQIDVTDLDIAAQGHIVLGIDIRTLLCCAAQDLAAIQLHICRAFQIQVTALQSLTAGDDTAVHIELIANTADTALLGISGGSQGAAVQVQSTCAVVLTVLDIEHRAGTAFIVGIICQDGAVLAAVQNVHDTVDVEHTIHGILTAEQVAAQIQTHIGILHDGGGILHGCVAV